MRARSIPLLCHTSGRRALVMLGLFATSGCDCGENVSTVNGAIAADPAELDFGSVPVGAEKRLPLGLENTGTFPLTVTGYGVDGPFVAPTATGTIGTAATRTVEVAFRPTALGAATGVLRVESDDPKVPVLEIPLRGTGIEAAVRVEPAAIDFGDVLWTTTTMPESRDVTISNPGTDAFEVTAIEVPESAMSAFSVEAAAARTRYAPGARQTFQVRFDPKVMGPVTGRVVVKTTARAATEVPVTLAARAVGPVLAVCAGKDGAAELCSNNGMNPRVDLGLVTLGSRGTGRVRILNTGDRPMLVNARVIDRPGAFQLAPDPAMLGDFMLMAGGEQPLVVAYQAMSYTFDTANLAIGTNSAVKTTQVVRLDARVPQPDVQAVPETYTFTLFGGGAMRSEGTIRVVNCGEIPLTLRGPATLANQTGPGTALSIVRGPAGGEMIAPGDCSATAPGQDVVVAFAPPANGSYAANLIIASDDPDLPMLSANLQGDKRP